jgi:hypothetical protein
VGHAPYIAAVDGPDLAPASRKRSRPDPIAEHLTPIVGDDLAARLASVEQAIVGLRHDVATGFQEVASRAVVLAEATDEILTRHAASLERLEHMLLALPEAIPQPDLTAMEGALRSLADGLITPIEAAVQATLELRGEVADLVARVEESDVGTLSSQVDLVSDRLSTLLGGPTLTELMDRLDEIADRGNR